MITALKEVCYFRYYFSSFVFLLFINSQVGMWTIQWNYWNNFQEKQAAYGINYSKIQIELWKDNRIKI